LKIYNINNIKINILLVKIDMITALSYLIESVPWIRRTSSNKILRWEGSNWKEINKKDISKLCQVEAQVSINKKKYN